MAREAKSDSSKTAAPKPKAAAKASARRSRAARRAPEQVFDSGGVPDTADGAPIVYYDADDSEFEAFMRADFANCECRTAVVDLTPRYA